jgi:hypothetical protein
MVHVYGHNNNSVALVRERTIPTERPPLVGEDSANFSMYRWCRIVSVAEPYGRNLGFLDRHVYTHRPLNLQMLREYFRVLCRERPGSCIECISFWCDFKASNHTHVTAANCMMNSLCNDVMSFGQMQLQIPAKLSQFASATSVTYNLLFFLDLNVKTPKLIQNFHKKTYETCFVLKPNSTQFVLQNCICCRGLFRYYVELCCIG